MSLKNIDPLEVRTKYFQLFGIQVAAESGILPKDSISVDALMDIFRQLKKENGKPCVLVVDDAQVNVFYAGRVAD